MRVKIISIAEDGGIEMSWIPSGRSCDNDEDGRKSRGKQQQGRTRKKGVEVLGAGMEKGGGEEDPAARLFREQSEGGYIKDKGLGVEVGIFSGG